MALAESSSLRATGKGLPLPVSSWAVALARSVCHSVIPFRPRPMRHKIPYSIGLGSVVLVYVASWLFPFSFALTKSKWLLFGGGQFGVAWGEQRIVWRWEGLTIDETTGHAPVRWWFDHQQYPITGTSYQIPLWTVPVALIVVLWTLRQITRVRRRARRACVECGYDIRELPTCPECGQIRPSRAASK